MKNVQEYAVRCLKDEAEAILSLIPQLDENFDKAVDMIYSCKGKVIVTGVGKSGNIGSKIAATLSSTGTPAFFINPLDVFHGDLGVMTPDDVVLALSNSGNTDELLRFLPMILHMKVPVIAMSGNSESLLAKYSDVHIKVKVEKEDVEAYAREVARMQFMQYGLMHVEDAYLDNFAQEMLKKEDQLRGIVERVAENKIYDALRGVAKVEEKAISHEDFGKLFA